MEGNRKTQRPPSRGDGRSIKEQIGNSWILLVILALGGLLYFASERAGAPSRHNTRRGVLVSARNVAPPSMPTKRATPATPRPETEDDRPPCTGTVSSSGTALIQQSIAGDVTGCLREAALPPGDPSMPTGMSLTIGIGGELERLEVQVEGTAPAALLGCLRNAAGDWSLPAPTGGACAQVNIPFGNSPVVPAAASETESASPALVEEDVQGEGS